MLAQALQAIPTIRVRIAGQLHAAEAGSYLPIDAFLFEREFGSPVWRELTDPQARQLAFLAYSVLRRRGEFRTLGFDAFCERIEDLELELEDETPEPGQGPSEAGDSPGEASPA